MITLYRFRDIDSRRLFRDCNIYEIENVMNCFSRDFCVKCVSLCDSSQFLFHSSKAFNASMIICISLQLCNVCISIYCLDWRIATLPRSLQWNCVPDHHHRPWLVALGAAPPRNAARMITVAQSAWLAWCGWWWPCRPDRSWWSQSSQSSHQQQDSEDTTVVTE